MVGLIPLYAVTVLELKTLQRFPGFKRRMEWFIRNRPDLKEKDLSQRKWGRWGE